MVLNKTPGARANLAAHSTVHDGAAARVRPSAGGGHFGGPRREPAPGPRGDLPGRHVQVQLGEALDREDERPQGLPALDWPRLEVATAATPLGTTDLGASGV